DRGVHVRLARLRDARQRRGRGRIDDVERVAVLALGPAPADEQPECAAVSLQPLERRLVALGRGAVRHRLEDLAHRGHAELITTPTGSVALTGSLPVDVLMKSAPAIIATWLARATCASVARSPLPRITFMCAGPHASRNSRISSYSASQSPASACARVITTSISRAPAATDARISSTRWGRRLSPAGNPGETAATGMPEPWRAGTAAETKAWYTHTAPTLIPRSATPSASIRSWRTGWRALAHSRRTLPAVSSPCSVVKSMQVIARSSQAACHSFLTVRRVGMVAARRSMAL